MLRLIKKKGYIKAMLVACLGRHVGGAAWRVGRGPGGPGGPGGCALGTCGGLVGEEGASEYVGGTAGPQDHMQYRRLDETLTKIW